MGNEATDKPDQPPHFPRATLDGRPIVLAPPGTVCRECWHGLKGLPYGSVCPECGASIGAGMDPLWWGNGPTAPIARVASAAKWLVWGTVTLVGLMILMAATDAIMSSTRVIGSTQTLDQITSWFGMSAWLAFLSLLTACTFCLRNARLCLPLLNIAVTVFAALSGLGVVFAALQSTWLTKTPNASALVVSVCFALATLTIMILWSLAQRRAAVLIGVRSLRIWTFAQLAGATLITLLWFPTAVYTMRIYISPSVMPGRWVIHAMHWAGVIVPWVMVPTGLLLPVNAWLLRSSLLRFLAARSAAA